MANNGKILVSMTSYPGRIKNVGMSIFLLLTQQTLPPDEIHLWLAIPQFPNKEADLPSDLQKIVKHPKVTLHWTLKDTYCHKRHEIFKTAQPNDLVFLFDDDVKYNDNLIATIKADHEKYPNAIIDYNWYSEHLYKGIRILYGNYGKIQVPSVRLRWCGQSMIPAKVYPKEVLSDSNQEIRDKICPICDESWLTPWLVYHNIPIYCKKFGWGDDIDSNNGKSSGLVKLSHSVDSNGYEKRDNWLNIVLNTFPHLKKKYEELFNYGK